MTDAVVDSEMWEYGKAETGEMVAGIERDGMGKKSGKQMNDPASALHWYVL